jgi:hypothetical protein
MQFENVNIENLVSHYRDFSVEGLNIFATGQDNLPHLICTCPNKDMARAIQSLVTIVKRVYSLQVVNAYITSHCYLSPKILADGGLGLVAWIINDAVYVDGIELKYNEPELQLGTSEYENFVRQFLVRYEQESKS